MNGLRMSLGTRSFQRRPVGIVSMRQPTIEGLAAAYLSALGLTHACDWGMRGGLLC